jgi:chemotaxis protein CheZ
LRKKAIEVKTFALSTQVTRAVPRRARRRSAMRKANSAARAVPAQTATTRGHLREIVMAQEFQDLTGQVLKRITELANNLETQLLKLLVENSPAPVNNAACGS